MTIPAAGTPLPGTLLGWLVEQRWFGDRGRSLRGASIVAAEPVRDGLAWVLVDVDLDGGPPVTYQLFLPLPLGSGTDLVADPAAMAWLFPTLASAAARPLESADVRLLEGEQSNTSLVVGGWADGPVIVKVFRRVGLAPNPDVEVVQRLWEAGFRRTPEPLASSARDGRDLAVARRFLPKSSSGWQMALDDPWFLREVGDLGRVTAQLHVGLAAAFGTVAPDTAGWAAAMARQLARVDLGTATRAVAARYEAFGRLAPADAGRAIRIHGDYHLGQVLHWRGDWYVLDFEGEPARPVAERIAPSSPLRDVAGMLRSFGYAAAVGGLPATWEERARRLFLDAYLATPDVGELLPADPSTVLAAFELDKAVYEIAYEQSHRPDWVRIPLRAVEQLLG